MEIKYQKHNITSYKSFNSVFVAFGSLSKSSVLVRSSIGPLRSFLYFGILLTETAATSERFSPTWRFRATTLASLAAGRFRCNSVGHPWQENELPPLVEGLFFFTRASPLFPVRGLWGFLHILIIFFFNSI